MAWKKLNNYADIWDSPVLGTEEQKDGKRFMALSLDAKSKNPYQGIARQVIERQGSPDVPGFLDKSKLVIVESNDLLSWKVVSDLEIKGIQKIADGLTEKGKKFIGLEDPDIIAENN